MKAIWFGLFLFVWPVGTAMLLFLGGNLLVVKALVPTVAGILSTFAFPSMGLGFLISVTGIVWEFWAIWRRRKHDA